MEVGTRKLSGVTRYNPDEFILSKQDVMDLVDAVILFWKKNPKENALYIAGLKTMKFALYVTPERSVKKIWNTLLHFIFRIQYENALAHAMKNKESWSQTLSKLKKKIAVEGIEKL